MKPNCWVILAALVILAGVSAGTAKANKVVVNAPDPADCSTVDISSPNTEIDPTGDYYVTMNGTITSCLNFTNATGMTLDMMDINIMPTQQGSPPPSYFCIIAQAVLTNAFDECGASDASTPPPPGQTILVLNCDPSVGTCDGLAPGATGSSTLTLPEPTETELLLFGIGISFLGFAGRKGWEKIGSSWVSRDRLAAS